jgi:hypothetical protein
MTSRPLASAREGDKPRVSQTTSAGRSGPLLSLPSSVPVRRVGYHGIRARPAVLLKRQWPSASILPFYSLLTAGAASA